MNHRQAIDGRGPQRGFAARPAYACARLGARGHNPALRLAGAAPLRLPGRAAVPSFAAHRACFSHRAKVATPRFDNGNKWQPLQFNLPRTSARDLLIHGDSLVVATFGRGIWVMDDISPLRQLTPNMAAASAHLYKPGVALAIHQGSMNGTPLTKSQPTLPNPPDGAILYYSLRRSSLQAVTLGILDSSGKVINSFSSSTPPQVIDTEKINIVANWIVPQPRLGTSTGMHRFVWNLQPAPPKRPAGRRGRGGFGGGGFFGRGGGMVAAGNYTARLTVEGQTYSQPLIVKPDPRLAK